MQTTTPTRRAAIAGLAATALAMKLNPAAAAPPESDLAGLNESPSQSESSLYDDSQFEVRCRSLIPGDTLAGWEGEGYWFRREDVDGEPVVVAGRIDRPIPGNRFLCNTETFDNFDLRWSARIVGAGDNAGVQFRSRRAKKSDDVPAHEMIGYQCDIGRAWDRSVWGAIYDESRRRVMLAQPDPPVVVPPIARPDQPPATRWVSMRVVAVGSRIQTFVDDQRLVDYTEADPSIPAGGLIGLQIHGGPPAECWYRNVRILPLLG